MRVIGSTTAIGFLIVACAVLATRPDTLGAGEPASQPDRSNPDSVQWSAHCDLDDGRRFLTDGGLLLESRYVPAVPAPEKSVPAPGAQRLLQSATDHEFGLADLDRRDDAGHYLAPGAIHLNRKYIDLLRNSPLRAAWRFRAKGANDPVLILDGEKVVGVMMPMKQVEKQSGG